MLRQYYKISKTSFHPLSLPTKSIRWYANSSSTTRINRRHYLPCQFPSRPPPPPPTTTTSTTPSSSVATTTTASKRLLSRKNAMQRHHVHAPQHHSYTTSSRLGGGVVSTTLLRLPHRYCSSRFQSSLFRYHGTGGRPRGNTTTSSLSSNSIKRGSSGSSSGKSRRQRRWNTIAKTLKYTRIPFLILSIYYLGYQQGMIDYSRDPDEKRRELMSTILQQAGGGKSGGGAGDDEGVVVRIATEGEWKTKLASSVPHPGTGTDAQLRRVARVAEQIVRAGRSYVLEQIQTSVQRVKLELPPQNTKQDQGLQEMVERDGELAEWIDAKKRMGMIHSNHTNNNDYNDYTESKWSFVLFQSPVPNAFVSEIIPHHIFVTTSFLDQYIANDDELALVLGHELSHLILGHDSEQNFINVILRTLEILCLSLDPSEGLLSVLFIPTLALIRNAIAASHSRHNEMEADMLGIKIAAMACFDTRRAPQVFRKMVLQDLERVGGALPGVDVDVNGRLGRRPTVQHEMATTQGDQSSGEGGGEGVGLDTTRSSNENNVHGNDKGQHQESDVGKPLPTSESRGLLSFMDTHPPTTERYMYLEAASEEENADRYKDTHCISLKKKFLGSWNFTLSQQN